MKGEIELYNISFLILKVNLHFKYEKAYVTGRKKNQFLSDTFFRKRQKSFFFLSVAYALLYLNVLPNQS